MPRLLTSVVFILSLGCSLVWGKPPAKSQKGNIAHTASAEQTSNETITEFLPSASGMAEYLTSVLTDNLWTHSIHESCFQPCLQPCTDSQPGNKKGKNRPQAHLSGPSPAPAAPSSSSSPSPDDSNPPQQPPQGEESTLTLAECSRLVSAFIGHPEWQDFLDSGRHVTTQTIAVKTGWNELKLDTVGPADKKTPFPALTPAALEGLMQLSPTISRLSHQLQNRKDPLADRDELKAFINIADQDENEWFAGGNHSLVIKWRKGPGYVLKIARTKRDSIRLTREQNLYLWLRNPDNILLNLTTTPMRAAFSVYDKPVLALRQVDYTARNRLLLMREHHSLYERLDFALSVVFHFCRMYRRFLDKDVLLADRHDDNIGFNEIPLPGRISTFLDDAILQVPVMLDLDPYWFGDQESREMQLHLPTWVPVVIGLLEEVFTPVNSNSQIGKSRVEVIDKIREFASPFFSSSSSSALPETEKPDRESALQNCVNHWFQDINPECGELLAEARSHIEPLLTRLSQWDSTPRTVTELNKQLQQEMEEVLQWLNNWKNETRFSLLEDFTDEGIIRVPATQGRNAPWDQEILTLVSMVHGKLGCQKCSRTFATKTEFRKHWQLHQQNRIKHCDVCGEGVVCITKHKRVHTGEKTYQCKHCGKCFLRSGNLQVHLRTHAGDKPYKCNHCDKCLTAAASLKEHLRTHSGDKPYKCEHCGKYFSHKYSLKGHLLTHSGDKPYKCEECGKRFSQDCNLQRHLRTHSGDKPYKCGQCGKCFSQRSHLQNHLHTHSGDRPHKCEHCGKCFSRSDNLQVHLRTHSGYKPYKCDLCGKCFGQAITRERHLRIHSGDKPYKCEYCDKCFSRSSNLQAHLRNHSSDKP